MYVKLGVAQEWGVPGRLCGKGNMCSITGCASRAAGCIVREMRKRDTFDAVSSVTAAVADAIAVFAGLVLATAVRFDSGWFPVPYGRPDDLYGMYVSGAAIAALIFILVFRAQGLYIRPQTGTYINKIPRILKAVGAGVFIVVVIAFAVKNEADFSRLVIGISLFTVSIVTVFERWIMFRIEWNLARHSRRVNRVLILGSDDIALHIKRTIENEPMLRSRVEGFLRVDLGKAAEGIDPKDILGTFEDLDAMLEDKRADQVILSGAQIGHDRIVEIMLKCERNMVTFNMVPDLFRILTSSMDVQSLNDIPMLGIGKWPLDNFWNRVLKRLEDVAGASVGLVVTSPLMLVCGLLVKRESPGPMFYSQERCGEDGRSFKILKLRTMKVDAEKDTGPVFTAEDDPRRTRTGAFLRRHNLDELPQLWNVLKGEMSLVGPRPERPHFVEQFKDDIGRYMSRHASKPGMTGWAQVNGLRGNTSIKERVKYDLYYLENWSLAFDFKIILRTFFAGENAY